MMKSCGEFASKCEPCDKLVDVHIYKLDTVPGIASSLIHLQLQPLKKKTVCSKQCGTLQGLSVYILILIKLS